MKSDEMPCLRAPCPFDDSARERLRRMGLLDEIGRPDKEAVAVLAVVYSGQFFDDLCDAYQDIIDLREALLLFIAEAERTSPWQRFFMLCLQYDAIHMEIPTPIWWISDDDELSDRFFTVFVSHLAQLAEEGE